MERTRTEELWNAGTHGAGVILGSIGLFVLLYFDTEKTPYSTASIVAYGVTLVFLYGASTLFHITEEKTRKKFWQKIDHIGIYLLIAGTHTPVALILLEESAGWTIFYVVWSVALVGSVLKIFFTGKYEALSVLFYIITGWIVLLDMPYLIEKTGMGGLFLILLGGGLYSLGVVFYLIKRPYYHVIWHFFVLAGSLSHFLFILRFVI